MAVSNDRRQDDVSLSYVGGLRRLPDVHEQPLIEVLSRLDRGTGLFSRSQPDHVHITRDADDAQSPEGMPVNVQIVGRRRAGWADLAVELLIEAGKGHLCVIVVPSVFDQRHWVCFAWSTIELLYRSGNPMSGSLERILVAALARIDPARRRFAKGDRDQAKIPLLHGAATVNVLDDASGAIALQIAGTGFADTRVLVSVADAPASLDERLARWTIIKWAKRGNA